MLNVEIARFARFRGSKITDEGESVPQGKPLPKAIMYPVQLC